MLRRALFILATFGAIVAFFFARQSTELEPAVPLVGGHKNTVLFITDSHRGLCHVHLATAFALLEHHASVKVHYASFSNLEKEVARVSESARNKNPNAQSIQFHQLMTGSDYKGAAKKEVPGGDIIKHLISPPGLRGIAKFASDLTILISPWGKEAHLDMYREAVDLIQNIDPAVVVLDSILSPAVNAAHDLNRVRTVITPNALPDLLAQFQPRAGMFWKYPAMASGLPFPIPWRLIPLNVYQQIRFAYTFLTSPLLKEKSTWLQQKGIKDPIHMSQMANPDVPWLTMSFNEATLPLEFIPQNFHTCGPIVVDTAPVEAQDAELAAWLKQAPTVLVNLGSGATYTKQMALSMLDALIPLMNLTEVQILWKFRNNGEYSDDFLDKAKTYTSNGRLRVARWLKADTTSLLNTGDVVIYVNHGGASSYHEAVLAGVPQVILPMWADLYNFAQTAEYLGIGMWPGKDTAPLWEPNVLTEGFMKALHGEESTRMREKARALGEIARRYRGREEAADIIAKMAAKDV